MKHGIGKFRDNKLKVPKAMMTTEKKKKSQISKGSFISYVDGPLIDKTASLFSKLT